MKALAALLTAHAVSLTGNMMMIIALPLYVLNRTGSASATGTAGVFVTLPVVFGGLFGGVVVDRYGYRRSSVVADLTAGTVIAGVPLLGHTIGLPLQVLFALVFVSGLVDSPGQNARTAMLPEIAAAAGVPVERAMGWFEVSERGARLLGAPLAGLLVAGFGSLDVLAVDAGSFLLSAALIGFVVPRPLRTGGSPGAPETRKREGRPGSPLSDYFQQLRDGFAFAGRERLLRAVVLMVVVTNFLDAAFLMVLLPVYSDRDLGGAVSFGLLVGAGGGGALIGSLIFGLIGDRLPRRPTFIVAFTLAGGPFYLALAAGLPLPVLVGLKALTGLGAGVVNPIIGVVMLERIPNGLRARVFGLVNAGCWAGMPLGSLLGGAAINGLGLTRTLLLTGTGYLAVTLSPLRGGPWRSMDRRSFEPAQC